jgi:hypothetical protein
LTPKERASILQFPKSFHGYVSITDNGLPYDNILYFSISEIKKANIISIGELEKSNF